MIAVDAPGVRDYNGTLAEDRKLLAGAGPVLAALDLLRHPKRLVAALRS